MVEVKGGFVCGAIGESNYKVVVAMRLKLTRGFFDVITEKRKTVR